MEVPAEPLNVFNSEVRVGVGVDLANFVLFFFFNDTATTEIYTLSLHDTLPISSRACRYAMPRATCSAMSRFHASDRRRR